MWIDIMIIKKTIKTKFDEFMDHGCICTLVHHVVGKTTLAFELLRGKKVWV